ncbi:low molecular weight phosphatase family protein [Thalassobaculum sp. OXR-137]|uniref:arsenate-mycothiol transferase ArsC n=1 Tax=Thalassobaculum sp. OXR-137 TaxID=3100173 RepID=UPI0039FC81ED
MSLSDPFATIQQPSAVLFACSMNAVRSPMAEGILKAMAGTRIYVDSCGVGRGNLDPFVIEVMNEIGIDMGRHRPKSFDMLEDGFFDVIVSLSPEAQHRAIELTRTMACDIEYWPTLDVTVIEGNRETRLDAYRAVRDSLVERIRTRFAYLNQPHPSS